MSRRKLWGSLSLMGLTMGGAAFAVHCAPEESTDVTVITKCDVATLNVADPAEATVKVYIDTAAQLRERVTALNARFTKVCNEINADLNEPAGNEIHGACNRIADRVAAANAKAPVGAGGTVPVWVSVAFDPTCPLDGAVSAACVDQCSAKKGCDAVGTCPAASKRGTCAGNCTACGVASDTPAPCNGACAGECNIPPPPQNQGGVPACQGECRGTCNAPAWQGACSTGCLPAGNPSGLTPDGGTGQFVGICTGQCVGSCDGVAYAGGPAILDSGVNAPGTGACGGICKGSCIGQASGQCGVAPNSPAPCTGEFKGGVCPGVFPAGPNLGKPFCAGTCIGAGACTTTCKGVCTSATANCAGSCAGCEGDLSSATCATAPACPDVNPICASSCAMQAAVKTTCAGGSADIRVAGDYQLPTALANHIADFTAAAREANLLASNLGGVVQRTGAEFKAIGVVRDNARFCATDAPKAYEELRKLVNETVNASLVVRGTKF